MARLVLIVDDHELIRNKLCSLLKLEGLEVCYAFDGAESIRVAEERKPDLIVLDLAMPLMNGLEAARTLKSKMPSVTLLMFTNFVGPLIEREALLAGITAVYSKAAPLALVEGIKARLI